MLCFASGQTTSAGRVSLVHALAVRPEGGNNIHLAGTVVRWGGNEDCDADALGRVDTGRSVLYADEPT